MGRKRKKAKAKPRKKAPSAEVKKEVPVVPAAEKPASDNASEPWSATKDFLEDKEQAGHDLSTYVPNSFEPRTVQYRLDRTDEVMKTIADLAVHGKYDVTIAQHMEQVQADREIIVASIAFVEQSEEHAAKFEAELHVLKAKYRKQGRKPEADEFDRLKYLIAMSEELRRHSAYRRILATEDHMWVLAKTIQSTKLLTDVSKISQLYALAGTINCISVDGKHISYTCAEAAGFVLGISKMLKYAHERGALSWHRDRWSKLIDRIRPVIREAQNQLATDDKKADALRRVCTGKDSLGAAIDVDATAAMVHRTHLLYPMMTEDEIVAVYQNNSMNMTMQDKDLILKGMNELRCDAKGIDPGVATMNAHAKYGESG